jgi:FG-GAP-like repeat
MLTAAHPRSGFVSRAVLVLTVVGALLAIPASASALALMVEDLGAPGSALNARAYDTSRYMGAKYERRIVNVTTWDGSFDWKGKVGPYVDGAIANGLKPYLTITADPNFPGPGSRIPSAAAFKTACAKAATEFQGKVFDYSVWNEPNLAHVGNLSPTDYLNLYKACREGIKSVSSAANVYFGEFSTAASGWGGMNACQYFRAATTVNANLVTEGVAIHPYQFSSSPTTKTGTECNGIGRLGDWQLENTKAANVNGLKSPGGGPASILISEFGYCGERPPLPSGDPLTPNAAKAACPQNASGVANVQSEATRAAWVKEAYEWAKLFAGVTIFDYHTVIKRPAGDYLGNQGGYLWESGIIENPSGNWLPSVGALRAAVGPTNGAPGAQTVAASNVETIQATLNGSVDPNGLSTTYHFQYGPTGSYGSSTPVSDAGWAPGAGARSAAIGGLRPGTTYHYRIVASNVAGTSYGVDKVLTTPEPSLNGDGRADFVACANSRYVAAMSNGAQFGAPSLWSTWGCGPLTRLGDFTGDGKTDLLGPGGGTTWAVGVSSGSDFNGDGTQQWTTSVTNSPAWLGVGDFNGDGKDDMVTCLNSQYKVYLSTGSQFGSGTVWSSWGCGSLARVGDFTGDGKDDLIVPGGGTTWAVGVSSGSDFNGDGTQQWTTSVTNSPTWAETGDFNGDGKDDFATCLNNEYKVNLSTGTQLGTSSVWSTWNCASLAKIGDFSGDGKDDLIGPGANNTWAVGVSSGSNFNGSGTQTWLVGFPSAPAWAGAG